MRKEIEFFLSSYISLFYILCYALLGFKAGLSYLSSAISHREIADNVREVLLSPLGNHFPDAWYSSFDSCWNQLIGQKGYSLEVSEWSIKNGPTPKLLYTRSKIHSRLFPVVLCAQPHCPVKLTKDSA